MKNIATEMRISIVLAALVAMGCGDDSEGSAKCEELGVICHPIESDLAQQCHALGHEGDPEVCVDRYDECIAECDPG
jgi:hypothetical protein